MVERSNQSASLDVGIVLSLIKELALYEKAPELVEATEESLLRTLTFSNEDGLIEKQGYAKALIIFDQVDGAAAGMALFYTNYSTWRSRPGVYLEDLFIRPKYRLKGYGKLLLRQLAREVKSIDGGRLEWVCLRWNDPALKFYKSIGAVQLNDWVTLRVDGDALELLADKADGAETTTSEI